MVLSLTAHSQAVHVQAKAAHKVHVLMVHVLTALRQATVLIQPALVLLHQKVHVQKAQKAHVHRNKNNYLTQ